MNEAINNKVYIETYGCQMNLNDSEIVSSILSKSGFNIVDKPEHAGVILLNTCSVRENAEKKIHERINHLKSYKKSNKNLVVGILGCMAERLKTKLIDEQKIVDLVVGPDEYRKVPTLIENAYSGEKGIAVKLSKLETYDDIAPLRTEGISAWVSIMRGCDKFCSFCVVPFTRGRERSRPLVSIVKELIDLSKQNFYEVTLLGQNVNSYLDEDSDNDFSDLLTACALAVPEMRIRYSTSHPFDMSDKLIRTMAEHDNICKHVHLPVQSGSGKVLQAMNRKYTVEHYLDRIHKIKELMPDCTISTDIIAGFPGETDEDHQLTLDLMKTVNFDGSYMYKYSPRENTKAWDMADSIPEKVKISRLNDIIELQHIISKEINSNLIDKTLQVLVEGPSKKSEDNWVGRTDSNKLVIFPKNQLNGFAAGTKLNVKIIRSTSATLFGDIV
jgi:tRNA-2-methylthio-N6-dimethylallyladenosine synthase